MAREVSIYLLQQQVRPHRGEALHVCTFLCGGVHSHSGVYKYLLCWSGGGSSPSPAVPATSPPLRRPVRIRYCLAGSPPPPGRPPPVGRARVIVDHTLDSLVGGSALGRRWVCCSFILGAPWQGCICLCAPFPVPTSLSNPWCGLGGGSIRCHTLPLLHLSTSQFQGLMPRLSLRAPPASPVSLLSQTAPVSPPLPQFPPVPPSLLPTPPLLVSASVLSTSAPPGGGRTPLIPGPTSRVNVGCRRPSARLLLSV